MKSPACRVSTLDSGHRKRWHPSLGLAATIVLLAVTPSTAQSTDVGGEKKVYYVEGEKAPEAVVRLAIEAHKRASEAAADPGEPSGGSSLPQPTGELLTRSRSDLQTEHERLRERLRRGLEAQRQLQVQLQETLGAYEKQQERVLHDLRQKLEERHERWEQVFQILDRQDVIEGPARERLVDLLKLLREGPRLRSDP
jgi:hypothetical protein